MAKYINILGKRITVKLITDLTNLLASSVSDLTKKSIPIADEDSPNDEAKRIKLSELQTLIGGSSSNFFVTSVIRTTENYVEFIISNPISQEEEITIYGEGFGSNPADFTLTAKKVSDDTVYTKANFGTPTIHLANKAFKSPIMFIGVTENDNIYIEMTKISTGITIKSEIISIVYNP